jgi:hypothetical protein
MLNLFHSEAPDFAGKDSSGLIKPNTSLLTRIFTQAQYEVNEYAPNRILGGHLRKKRPGTCPGLGKSVNLSG